jgi:hypothetical protein
MTALRDDWDKEEREALSGMEEQIETLRRRHGANPPLDLLRAAHAQLLPDDIQARVDQHLSESAWSRALVAAAEPDDDLLTPADQERLFARITKETRAQETAHVWTWTRPAFLVPAFVALASVAWLAFMVRAVPPTTQPEEAPVAIARADPPPFLLPFDKADVRLSMAALTWRGSAASDNRLLMDLKPGLDAYRAGDYATADRELTALAPRYPGTIEIPFYQGVSRLFLNDLSGAITSLTAAEAVGDGAFAADVSWYRAVAEQRAGNLAEARTRLDTLCRGNSAGANRACTALSQLTTPPSPR